MNNEALLSFFPNSVIFIMMTNMLGSAESNVKVVVTFTFLSFDFLDLTLTN